LPARMLLPMYHPQNMDPFPIRLTPPICERLDVPTLPIAVPTLTDHPQVLLPTLSDPQLRPPLFCGKKRSDFNAFPPPFAEISQDIFFFRFLVPTSTEFPLLSLPFLLGVDFIASRDSSRTQPLKACQRMETPVSPIIPCVGGFFFQCA